MGNDNVPEVADHKQPKSAKNQAARFLSAFFLDWLLCRRRIGIILIAATFIMVSIVLYTAIKPHQWIFSIEAQSRIIELATPRNKETKWRINNAILCLRTNLKLPIEKFTPITPGHSHCGGRRWSGYHILDPEQTLVLMGNINVVLELRENKSLFLALRMHRPSDDNKVAAAGVSEENRLTPGVKLSFTDGSQDIHLDKDGKLRVNIVFPVANSGAISERIFPFTAETTIGRDVNWTGSSLLTAGDIGVYTADNSPDKRKLVDEAKLLLGDQLRLHPLRQDNRIVYPKGFIRLEPGKDYFDVIAFGAADHVLIERFGDNGYDIRPGLFLMLINDQGLILATSVFVVLVSLITGIAGVWGKRRGS